MYLYNLLRYDYRPVGRAKNELFASFIEAPSSPK